jgi:hypothetical protein
MDKKIQPFTIREIAPGRFVIDYVFPAHASAPLVGTGESMLEDELRAKLIEMGAALETIDAIVKQAKNQN